MTDFKFNVGDRVRVIKIDDEEYYEGATYQVGDVGRVAYRDINSILFEADRREYFVEFDRLKDASKDSLFASLFEKEAVLEDWLEAE